MYTACLVLIVSVEEIVLTTLNLKKLSRLIRKYRSYYCNIVLLHHNRTPCHYYVPSKKVLLGYFCNRNICRPVQFDQK